MPKQLMYVDVDALHDAVRDASLNSDQAFPIFRALTLAPVDAAENRNRQARSKSHGRDRSALGKGYKPLRPWRTTGSPTGRKRAAG